MTAFRFRRDVYKAGGRDASKRVSYITRQPVRALHPAVHSPAVQQLRYIAEGREDCVFTTSRNLPAWAGRDPHAFFQAAETYERAGGIAFEEWKIALPVELSHGQNMALTHDLIDVIAGEHLPCTYAFHDPTTLRARQHQPHLHVLLSARQNDRFVRTPAQHFRRYNPQHPERGGARKDPAFRHMGAVMAHRVMIADVINLHLERSGCAERVHPATLESRGIDRKPEPKLWPSESRAYREAGQVSRRMQEVFEIRAQRPQTQAQEQADARRYWEERKSALGITTGMDKAVQLAKVGTARAQRRDHAPALEVRERYAGVERDESVLEGLGGEAMAQAWDEAQSALTQTREGAHAQSQGRPGKDLAQALHDLARQLDALREGDGGTGQVRVKLWDKEREPDRGLSW